MDLTREPPTSLSAAVGKEKASLGLSALLAVLASAAGLVPYVVVYGIVVELSSSGPTDEGRITTLALYAGVAVVARAVASGLSTHVAHVAAYRALATIRRGLVAKLGRVPLGRAQERSTGELKKLVHDDVEQLEEALAHGVPDIAAGAAVPVVTIVGLFLVDWRLALATLASLVVVLAITGTASGRAKANEAPQVEASARLNTAVVSYLQGMRVIRGFVRERSEFDEVRDALAHHKEIGDLPIINGRWLVSAMQAAMGTTTLLVVPVGVGLYAGGSIDLATLVLFLVLSLAFTQPLMRLTLAAATLYWRVNLASKSVAALFEEDDLAAPEEPRAPDAFDIAFDGVSFAYGDKAVLHDVRLAVPAGATLALVGPTGAGKSTLARLVARFWDVDEGAVRIGGVDVRDIGPAELMRRVAFVQQDDYLFDDTILENVRMGRPGATDDEVLAAAARARVDEFVPGLPDGWATRVGAGGARLSGGQRQRVSIARAFLKAAPIVVLDEATAFLDAENEAAVTAAVAELSEGRTVVVIAHRLATVMGADTLAVVDGGRVVAQGPHDELLERSDLYRELWRNYTDSAGWTLAPGGQPAPLPVRAVAADGAAPAGAGDPAGAADTPGRGGAVGESEAVRGIVVQGLDRLPFRRQFLVLLGRARGLLFRQGLPRLVAEGAVRSAPLLVVYLVLREVLDGDATSGFGWAMAGVLAALIVVRTVAGAAANRVVWTVSGITKHDVSLSILDRLRRVPLGFFQRYDAGRISTLVTNDVTMLDVQNTPGMVAAAVVQPVMAGTALALLDWRLALATLAGVPVFLVVAAVTDRAFHRANARLTEVRSRATGSLLEQVRGTAVLRAYPDAPQGDRYSEAVEDLRRASTEASVRTAPSIALGAIALELGVVALILLGSALYRGGSVDAETFLLFLVLTLVFYQPIQELNALTGYRRAQQQIAGRIAEVWDAPVLPEPVVPGRPADASVELRDVSFSYAGGAGDTDSDVDGGPDAARPEALRGVSFTVPEGKVTALVGPSGAGKSTVANLVARFWDVDRGAVLIGGVDVRDLRFADLVANVTTVYQDVYLFPGTVRANVTLGRQDATEDEIAAALDAAQCRDLVASLPDGLDTVVGEGGSDLSGGQRQRLSIARALLKGSPILVLDEAVASVDPATEARIQRAVEMAARCRTVVVVAHRLATVRNADRIVVLDGGTVAGVGTHDELLEASAAYRRMWAAQDRGRVTATAP